MIVFKLHDHVMQGNVIYRGGRTGPAGPVLAEPPSLQLNNKLMSRRDSTCVNFVLVLARMCNG